MSPAPLKLFHLLTEGPKKAISGHGAAPLNKAGGDGPMHNSLEQRLASSMEATHISLVVRPNREDCKRTKYDSAFSDWELLIGPNDWTDYLLRKEGAEKYRTQNLPNCTSCSGVYELGIAVPRRQAGREASRLDPNYIVPVYVGKSDNVRTRLQQYGREGAHLENGCSNSALHDQVNVSALERAGLFTEVFSRGCSIVYRWAYMNENKDAEKTEAKLLNRFDYAWNKGSNGVRRHNDVLRKLDDFHDTFESTYFLPKIVKFGRSQPRIVSVSSGVNNDPNNICGVALGHGSVCIRPPIKGNKRCAEHKGMKVNDVEHKGMRVKTPISKQLGAEIPSLFAGPATKISSEKTHGNIDIPSVNHYPICGATLLNDSFCRRKPSEGNKRCWQHNGAEIPSVFAGPSVTHSSACGATLLNGSFCRRKPSEGNKRCWQHNGAEIPSLFAGPSVNHSPACGATLLNGSFCKRKPSEGNKRCWQHNGSEIPSLFAGPSVNHSPACGATLLNGSFCTRKPSEGSKRCWQHNGAEMPSVFTGPSVNHSPACGATLLNGSLCRRKPSEGNKRCWQHYGRKS